MLRISSRSILHSCVETKSTRSNAAHEIKSSDLNEFVLLTGSPAQGVRLLQHKASGSVVIGKLIPKDNNPVPMEIVLACTLRHPTLARGYGYFQYNDESMVLLQEYISGHDLGTNLERCLLCMDGTQVMMYVQQVMEGVEYLHSLDIVHRDIKPSNIVLDADHKNAKLIDFGTACHTTNTFGTQQRCGTIAYMSPEVYNMRSRSHRQDIIDLKSADIWSCGVLIFMLLSGSIPWNTCTLSSPQDDKAPSEYIDDFAKYVGSNSDTSVLPLVSNMLSLVPNNRPNATSVLKSLRKVLIDNDGVARLRKIIRSQRRETFPECYNATVA
eukprot:CFRG1707T1